MMREIKIRRILVPVDGFEHSKKAMRHAIREAKLSGSEIIALHVLGHVPVGSAAAMKRYYGNVRMVNAFIKLAKQEASKWLSQLERMAKREKVAITSEILDGHGSIVQFIVDFASKKNIDLIVMGTRGRTRFKKLALGSVASGVITNADCPVLVAK